MNIRRTIIRAIDHALDPAKTFGITLGFCFVLTLTGCASAPYTDAMLAEADQYVAGVEYLPYSELQRACYPAADVSGCARLVTGEIYLLDHPDHSFRDCVLRHELSHIYDVYVKGISMEQTQTHDGWIVTKCYLPR